MISPVHSLQTNNLQEIEPERPAIGEGSRSLRFLIATLVVAFWWGLGRLLHANISAFTLLGVPLMLAFQLWIQRWPLRTLWVRSGPPIRIDAWFIVIWLLFSLVPLYNLVMALASADIWGAVTAFAAFVGAFGLTYALRSMRRSVSATGGSQWVLYFLAAAIVGLLPLIPALVLPQFLHMRINGQVSTPAVPSLLTILQVGLPRFLSGTIGFVVEEVFFRGCLDTYLHRGEKGTGWLSAIYISALWGLWHLPTAALFAGNLFGTVLSLLVSQIIIGVPLSLLWRKTGNLAVPDTTHALLEAVRSILAA